MHSVSVCLGGKLAIDLFLEEKPDQSTNSKPPATGSVNDVFKTLTAMMTPDLISEVNGSFSFDLTGEHWKQVFFICLLHIIFSLIVDLATLSAICCILILVKSALTHQVCKLADDSLLFKKT